MFYNDFKLVKIDKLLLCGFLVVGLFGCLSQVVNDENGRVAYYSAGIGMSYFIMAIRYVQAKKKSQEK